MGCDIHAYVEYAERQEDPMWWCVMTNIGERDYDLFGKMAGVRGSDDPMFPVRGIPEKTSWVVTDTYKNEEGDAHTASWLTLDEFRAVLADHTMRSDYRYGPDYTAALAAMEALEARDLQTRIVFWFDN